MVFVFSTLVHDEYFTVGFPPLIACTLGHDTVKNFGKDKL